LCKQQSGFTCPMVANISSSGSNYSYVRGAESTWTTTGSWGSGGAVITVSGNSRCSGTSGSYPNIGNPSSGGGQHCWCQIINAGFSGAWAYLYGYGKATDCASDCAFSCAGYIGNSAFRFAVCRPQVLESCDVTTVLADSLCPAGYAQCIGSKSDNDTAGDYTITCSE
jgi:hypothetical protein